MPFTDIKFNKSAFYAEFIEKDLSFKKLRNHTRKYLLIEALKRK